MNRNTVGMLRGCILCLILVSPTFGQKVTVGYDKSVDFSRYKSYTRPEPTNPPARPMLYMTIAGAIDDELKSKNLQKADGGGDLLVICTGGIDFGLNTPAGTPLISTLSGPPPAIEASMWTGASGLGPSLMAPYVAEGTLMVTFIESKANKIVWSGTVTQKFDTEKKEKSLQKADKAVVKLLSEFPPKKK